MSELLPHDLSAAGPHALRAFVEALPAAAFYRQETDVYVNDALVALLGYSRDEIRSVEAWFEPLYGAEGPARRALYETRRAALAAEPHAVWMTRRDGVRRLIETVGYVEPHVEVWLLRDVTARRELERALLDAREHEQRRLGRDLHDGLGAHLTGVAMLCRTLARQAEKGQAVPADALGELADLVQEGIASARALARGLDPVGIETIGLAGALQDLADATERRAGVRCRLVADAPALPPDVATHLYRIAQEATANALTHSGTDTLDLALRGQGGGVTLTVGDRGCGMPPDASGGLGLHAMRFRAGAIGATLTHAPRPGGGTLVTCRLPAEP